MRNADTEEKAELRRSLRPPLAEPLAPEKLDRVGTDLLRLVQAQAVWSEARSVLFFSALPGEIDLTGVMQEGLKEGKRVCLPRFDPVAGGYAAAEISAMKSDTAPGQYGILEPLPSCPDFPLKQLDLVFVPGLGFDAIGHRLGRGRGHYDRLLLGLRAAKCGVAWDWQIVGRIPAEAHDVKMDFILTPTRWLAVSNS